MDSGILRDPWADSGGEGKSKQAEKYGTKEKSRTARRAPGDNVLPDQFLFLPFFTFLRALFFRPFRLSVAPTILPLGLRGWDPGKSAIYPADISYALFKKLTSV